MRNATVLTIFLAATLASPVFAESPFVGKWTATAIAPTGNVSESIVVTRTDEGYSVVARLIDPQPGQPEAGPGTDIVLEGNSFSYKRSLDMGNGKLVITYSGVVSGDTFTGTVDLGFAKTPYNGVRVKDE